MTSATNRRAVLGAVLAAGAAVSVSAIPAASEPALGDDHPDAALLALAPEIEAADREFELRYQITNAAEDVFFSIKPEKPETPKSLTTITAQALEETMAQGRWDVLGQWRQELLKHDEALENWSENLPRAEIDSGLAAAEEAQNEADKVCLMIRDEKLIPTRARTIDGLIFKARYAARFDYDENVMVSIVDDLLALAADRVLAENEEDA
jgi:hypothetical protein